MSAAVSPVRGVHMTHLVSNTVTNVGNNKYTFVAMFETKCVICTPRTGDTAALSKAPTPLTFFTLLSQLSV